MPSLTYFISHHKIQNRSRLILVIGSTLGPAISQASTLLAPHRGDQRKKGSSIEKISREKREEPMTVNRPEKGFFHWGKMRKKAGEERRRKQKEKNMG